MRSKLMGVRVTDQEMERVKSDAAPDTVSTYVRRKIGLSPEVGATAPGDTGAEAPQPPRREIPDVLVVQQTMTREEAARRYPNTPLPDASEPDPAELPLTWADHWALMEKMEQGEALERFAELQRGRKLPAAFRGWPKATKIAWLDREWAL